MNILIVSSADIAGGAEKVAWALFQEYRRRGHGSRLAVGMKRTDDPGVLVISNERYGLWIKFWHQLAHKLDPLVGKNKDAARIQ